MRAILLLAGSLGALGCNQVLGIDAAEIDPLSLSSNGPSARAGESCPLEGELDCGTSADGSRSELALLCTAGKWVESFACPGLQGCRSISTTTVGCGSNLPLAVEGSICDATVACSADATLLLTCDQGTWRAARHCAPSTCVLDTQKAGLQCANGGYAVGDDCNFPAGKVACSTDLAHVLVCQSGLTTSIEECTSGKLCTSVIESGQPVIRCQ